MEVWKDIKGYENLYQISSEGNFIREWKSAQEVRRELGFSSESIGNCCRKLPRYYTAYGYIWRYKEERAA